MKDATVDVLVYTKNVEEVCQGCSCRSAALAFLKRCAQVITFGEHSLLAEVKAVGKCVEMYQSTSQFQVQIGDGAMQV